MACVDEVELLTAFWDVAKHYDTIVTFNGRGFDVPFVYLRSPCSTCRLPARTGSATASKPSHTATGGAAHILQRQRRDGAARRFNLDFYCKAFGIESPKLRA